MFVSRNHPENLHAGILQYAIIMNVNDNDNNEDDVDLTVSQGCYLLEEAHKCIMEAIGLFSGEKEGSEVMLDRHTFQLAVHALRRGVLAVRVIELFPSDLFEELARSEHEKVKRKISEEFMRCDAFDGTGSGSDSSKSETLKTSEVRQQTEYVVNELKRHLIGITLMCYSVLLLYYVAHTERSTCDFIHALDYCNDVLSSVPGTGTSLFDRELALLHARHLMQNCKFNESDIEETVKICMMLFEEEQRRELRDSERMHYLQAIMVFENVSFGNEWIIL
ncbi:Stretch-activated cation channel [Dirofilaria immitis]